jgi:tetratricopeptide (TPR) repeat protein
MSERIGQNDGYISRLTRFLRHGDHQIEVNRQSAKQKVNDSVKDVSSSEQPTDKATPPEQREQKADGGAGSAAEHKDSQEQVAKQSAASGSNKASSDSATTDSAGVSSTQSTDNDAADPDAFPDLTSRVLAYYREPKRYAGFKGKQTLPDGVAELLETASGRVRVGVDPESENEEDAEAAKELVAATVLFAKKVLLAPESDYYRILGLTPQATMDAIQNHYKWLRRIFWQEESLETGHKYVMRISEAYVELRDPARRQVYNDRLLGLTPRRARSAPRSNEADMQTAAGVARSGAEKGRGAVAFGKGIGAVAVVGVLIWYMSGDNGTVQTDLADRPLNDSTLASSDTGVTEFPGSPESQSSIAQSATGMEDTVKPAPLNEDPFGVDAGDADTPVAAMTSSPASDAPSNIDSASALVADVSQQPVPSQNVAEAAAPEPDPVFSAEDSANPEISRLLAKANEQYEASLLTQPPGNNAYLSYQQVLELEPDNTEALEGLQNIADRYVGMARYRQVRERYEEALAMVAKGLSVVPHHKTLLALMGEISAQRRLARNTAADDVSNEAVADESVTSQKIVATADQEAETGDDAANKIDTASGTAAAAVAGRVETPAAVAARTVPETDFETSAADDGKAVSEDKVAAVTTGGAAVSKTAGMVTESVKDSIAAAQPRVQTSLNSGAREEAGIGGGDVSEATVAAMTADEEGAAVETTQPDSAGKDPQPAKQLAMVNTSVPSAALDALNRQELDLLVDRFVSNYEAGNLGNFLSLFAEDARTNNRQSRDGIEEDYKNLFMSTESRLMTLDRVRWNIQDGNALGEGDFNLTIIKAGEARPRSYNGRLTFQVSREEESIMIKGLFHSQSKLQ